MIEISQNGVVFIGSQCEFKSFLNWIKKNIPPKTKIKNFRKILINHLYSY